MEVTSSLAEAGLQRLTRREDEEMIGIPAKKQKQRHRGREKKNGKKLLFYAAFQTVHISQGVHTDIVDTKDSMAEHNSKEEASSKSEAPSISHESDVFEDVDTLDCYKDYEFHTRKSNCSITSTKSTTGSQPSGKGNRCHIPGLTKVSKENKTSRREWNISKNSLAQKENIGKRLDKEGLKKFGYDIYDRRADPLPQNRKKHSYQSKKNYSTSHGSSRRRRHHEDHPAALKYELKSSNMPDGTGTHLDKIIDLQHRDLTPEDYELLLLLDESVAPKTVSENLLQSLAVVTVEAAEAVGELCSICMEVYLASQTVKKLPCTHFFHEQCIDMWLSNSSLNCPLDGLAVEVT